jgi:hypothetical protein
VDKHSDGSFALKTLKQKLFVDGLCYLIQEIYGVERKSSDEVIDEEIDDTGSKNLLLRCRRKIFSIIFHSFLLFVRYAAFMLVYRVFLLINDEP